MFMRMSHLRGMRWLVPATLLGLALAPVGCQTIEGVAADYCQRQRTCDASTFAEDYGSQASCEERHVDYTESLIEHEGSACGQAHLDYEVCIAVLPCEDDPRVACDLESVRFERLCYGWPEYCSGYVGDNRCCQVDNPCHWSWDGVCDCQGACEWEGIDCR